MLKMRIAGDVLSLPRVANPDIVSGDGGVVPTTLHHIGGQNTLLGLILVLLKMKNTRD
jgi:hypothetical protein